MQAERLLELAVSHTGTAALADGARAHANELFYIEGHEVVSGVTAYICPNTTGDPYWWCPRIGASVPGSSLYETELEARLALIADLRRRRARIEETLQSEEDALYSRRLQ